MAWGKLTLPHRLEPSVDLRTMRGLGGNQEVAGLDRLEDDGWHRSRVETRIGEVLEDVTDPGGEFGLRSHAVGPNDIGTGDAGADRRRGEHRSADTSIDRLQVVSETLRH